MSHLNITRSDLKPFESTTKRYGSKIHHFAFVTHTALAAQDRRENRADKCTYPTITITKVYGGAESASLAKWSKRS